MEIGISPLAFGKCVRGYFDEDNGMGFDQTMEKG
jgi:hypothetical protein